MFFSFPQKKQLVYYESRKQELKTRPIYDCWFDERLKTDTVKPTRLAYTRTGTVETGNGPVT